MKTCQFCKKSIPDGGFHMCSPEDLKGEANSAIASALDNLNSSKVSDIVNSAKASALSRMDMSSIKNSLPTSGGLFGAPLKKINEELSSTTNEYIKNIQQAGSNFTDFSQNISATSDGAAEGITTFITNTSKESIIPFELPGAGGPFDIGSMGKDLLGRIGDFSGLNSITNGSQLTKALDNISKNFSDVVDQAVSFTGMGESSLSSLLGGITEPLEKVTGGFSLSGALDSIGSFIPDSVKDIVSTVTDTVSGVVGSIGNVLSSIPGLGGVGEALQDVLGLTTSKYDSITNKDGSRWGGISPNSSYGYKDLNKLHGSAQILCPDIPGLDDLVNFSELKDLYDTLIHLAANNGLTDLLDSLLNCGQQLYTDARTYDVLAESINGTARRGDVNSLRTILDTVGTNRVSNPLQLVRTTATNLDSFSTENIDTLMDIARELGVDYNDLIKNETGSLSAPTIYAMSLGSPQLLKTFDPEKQGIQSTAIAVLDLYGEKKPTDRSYMGI